MRSEILLIIAAAVLAPSAGRAQESGGAVACPNIANDSERLACYDRAMRGAVRAPEPVAAPASTAAASPVAAAPAAAPAAVAPAGAGVVAASAATAAVVAPTAQAVAPAATAAAAPTSTITTAPHTPRNAHASAPAQPGAPATIDPVTGSPTGIVPIVVLSTRSRPGFGTEFKTDRGDVWVQIDPKPLNLPKAPFDAQLEPGSLGGIFLVVPDRKLGIRVRGSNP
jgi:hypothetical protein